MANLRKALEKIGYRSYNPHDLAKIANSGENCFNCTTLAVLGIVGAASFKVLSGQDLSSITPQLTGLAATGAVSLMAANYYLETFIRVFEEGIKTGYGK